MNTILYLLVSLQILINPPIVIKGAICNDKNEAIPNASIRIQSQQTNAYYWDISNEDGSFSINVRENGSYHIEISYIGEVLFVDSIRVNTDSYDIGNIQSTVNPKVLEEIEIVAKRKLFKSDINKIAYDIRNDPAMQNKTLYESIRRIPFVSYNRKGDIQVKGGAFRVYVNGKPDRTFLRQGEVFTERLKKINNSKIHSIELIKDNQDGSSLPIINIITENDFYGVMGSINGSVGNITQYNIGGDLSLKKGKLGFSSMAFYRESKGHEGATNTIERTRQNNQQAIYTASTKNVLQKNKPLLIQAALTYEMNKSNIFYIEGTYNTIRFRDKGKIIEQEHGYDFLLSGKEQKNLHDLSSITATYEHYFNKPGSMLHLSYRFQMDDLDADVFNTDADFLANNRLNSYSKIKDRTHSISLRANYPFTENHAVFGNMLARKRTNDTQTSYSTNNKLTGLDKTTTYIYADLGYVFTYSKVRLNTAISFEGGRNELISYDKKDQAKDNFTHVNPSFTLTYQPLESLEFKAAYSNKISRPNITMLNPNRIKTGEYAVFYGNPNLEDVSIKTVSAAAAFYADKLSAYANLDYLYTNNGVYNYSFIDEDNIKNTTYGNILKQHTLSTKAGVAYNLSSKLDISLDGMLNHYNVKGKVIDRKKKFISSQVELIGSYNALDNLNFRAGATGYVKNDLQLDNNWIFSSIFSVGTHLFNYKLFISLDCYGIERKFFKQKTKYLLDDYQELHHSKQPLRDINLTIRYNFGSLKKAIKQTLKLEYKDKMP